MYQAVNAILEKHDADVGAAEAHGVAVGMLCVEVKADAANWLHQLFADEHALPDDDKSLLLNLFERTRDLLEPETEEFAFDLFLPDDDEPLNEQVEALRSWCEGFLFGVGYAQSNADWPGDSAEVMRDIVELTKIDSDVEGEEDEAALLEIHEYLRAAVLTVRDLFSEDKNAQLH
ncbi:UPF0149 family protein [Methylomonas rapida]|uniref:UPF0149 family protein n=1 Tax=Methylomonas rapida TaxID=2963939 RepID=A0ABY7GLJ5_9GAMM|nr:UPF0149 family protein [Methylomonas rapida]WAR45367.1 UPF0149 family protein [Methylomonas rapida]